ncbi:chorismate--pyruvate lyase family protein [Legionella waltersii]|uniref:4-hydroxybenzoate synthetase n=1 Tax=Legionella waltersii TaxID=66969 RepID=A0A0W1ALQ9_9GAMM|nr:chorismate lyase [Legionella waltersii]KTD82271.1 4-hydroxybenzoate synthetase [Legionella waltersii]SNV04360.1 4-hydroxybenzoate synthetase [Legionella waltersii]
MNSQLIYTTGANHPANLNEWLSCSTSLTDKLQAIIGKVELKVLNQQWTDVDWFVRHMLHVDDQSIFLREILMNGCEHHYWYARTIIPQSCYQIDPEFFRRLENESMRNLIFDGQRVKRGLQQCYSISEFNIEYHWVKKYLPFINATLWLRLVQYQLDDKEHFYLYEILLPDLERV